MEDASALANAEASLSENQFGLSIICGLVARRMKDQTITSNDLVIIISDAAEMILMAIRPPTNRHRSFIIE